MPEPTGTTTGGEAAAPSPGRAGPPRRLVVLRHGQTGHNARGIWQGQLDTELSEQGHAQAARAAEALVRLSPARVVSSDLQRAADTGRDVARVAGVSCDLDARLREIHVGEWAGLTGDQVRERYPEDQDRLLSGEDFRRGGHGESVADVADRVRGLLHEVVDAMDPGECVVLSTHGVTARTLVADLVGLDQKLAWTALGGLGNCHWAELVEGDLGWRIVAWNAHA